MYDLEGIHLINHITYSNALQNEFHFSMSLLWMENRYAQSALNWIVLLGLFGLLLVAHFSFNKNSFQRRLFQA